MYVEYKIRFQGSLPPIEEVLTKLITTTGLRLVYNASQMDILCLDTDMILELAKGDTYYILLKWEPKIDYLLGAALLVLIELGGEYRGYIPPWANKKWIEVRNNLFDLPNFSLGLDMIN